MEQNPETIKKPPQKSGFRLLPLTIAGLVCFVVGMSSGAISWYFFGSNSPLNAKKSVDDKPTIAVVLPNAEANKNAVGPNVAATNQPTEPIAQPSQQPETPTLDKALTVAGTVAVDSGEIAIGGGDTGRPLQREFVNQFMIAETEVTNKQFREFLEATKESNDLSAKIKLPVDKDDEPVATVNWYDAKAYCDWLGAKIGSEVRLPSEAEWELAARGKNGWKYPWGNEWRDEAAASAETKGALKAVKSLPLNKSPFGAYDMAGNVWEWTSTEDKFDDVDENGQKKAPRYNEATFVIKGGSYKDAKGNISAQARTLLPRSYRLPIIGFRYVVVRNSSGGNAVGAQN